MTILGVSLLVGLQKFPSHKPWEDEKQTKQENRGLSPTVQEKRTLNEPSTMLLTFSCQGSREATHTQKKFTLTRKQIDIKTKLKMQVRKP